MLPMHSVEADSAKPSHNKKNGSANVSATAGLILTKLEVWMMLEGRGQSKVRLPMHWVEAHSAEPSRNKKN